MKSQSRPLRATSLLSHKDWRLISEMGMSRELNERADTPAGRRVTQIIELLHKAESLRELIRREVPERVSIFPQEDGIEPVDNMPWFTSRVKLIDRIAHLQPLNAQLGLALKKLNALLKRYLFSRQFRCRKYFSRLESGNIGLVRTDTKSQERWECKMVLWLTEERHFAPALRFRRCRNCRLWFYAVTQHQWHCSDACRKKLASKSPQFKESRRQYMAEYRRKEREAEQRAKEAVQFTKRKEDVEHAQRR